MTEFKKYGTCVRDYVHVMDLVQAYYEGVETEKARIIEIVESFKVLDIEFPETGKTISFPTEDLIAAINGK